MKPLVITARVVGGVALADGIRLDGLLAYARSTELQLPPIQFQDPPAEIEIPIAKEPGGRFHLCSDGIFEREAYSLSYFHKRTPISEFAAMGGGKIRRVDISTGVNKGYRIPLETAHLKGDVLTFYAIGDADRVVELLASITHLGRKRSFGFGRVKTWEVREIEGDTWEGFPVLLKGLPLRALPLDYPGLDPDSKKSFTTLTFPYWDHSSKELLATP